MAPLLVIAIAGFIIGRQSAAVDVLGPLIVMTSLYYSSAVLLFGAEFTAASARQPP